MSAMTGFSLNLNITLKRMPVIDNEILIGNPRLQLEKRTAPMEMKQRST